MKKKKWGRPTIHEKRYRNVGRPTLMTVEVIAKLEDAFTKAYSDEQACIHAGISKNTLYDYIKIKPEFGNRKEELKKRVDITAKDKIIEAINIGDMTTAKWWLERKCKDEFSLKTETEHKGQITQKVVYIEKEEKEEYEKHIEEEIE